MSELRTWLLYLWVSVGVGFVFSFLLLYTWGLIWAWIMMEKGDDDD